jgi:hypothetical protein
MNKKDFTVNVVKAIRTLAQCIDQLENVAPEVKQDKRFRSRLQLINDILEGKE